MAHKEERLRRRKAKIGCEVCGFKIVYGLHEHHCTPKNKRNSQPCSKIILCANCHNIFHHEIGWGRNFVDILTKDQSLYIIKRVYNKDTRFWSNKNIPTTQVSGAST